MKPSQPEIKFVSYVRHASGSQVNPREKLDRDLIELREIAGKEKLPVDREVFELASGHLASSRTGFKTMIEEVKSGRANGILCLSLEHLSRNMQDIVRLLELFNDGKLQVIRTRTKEFRGPLPSNSGSGQMALMRWMNKGISVDLKRVPSS